MGFYWSYTLLLKPPIFMCSSWLASTSTCKVGHGSVKLRTMQLLVTGTGCTPTHDGNSLINYVYFLSVFTHASTSLVPTQKRGEGERYREGKEGELKVNIVHSVKPSSPHRYIAYNTHSHVHKFTSSIYLIHTRQRWRMLTGRDQLDSCLLKFSAQ